MTGFRVALDKLNGDRPAYSATLTSAYLINKVMLGPNALLVLALQALLRNSPIHLDITWIHAGVLGNEAADGAATRGARASRAGRGLSDFDLRIRNYSFLT